MVSLQVIRVARRTKPLQIDLNLKEFYMLIIMNIKLKDIAYSRQIMLIKLSRPNYSDGFSHGVNTYEFMLGSVGWVRESRHHPGKITSGNRVH